MNTPYSKHDKCFLEDTEMRWGKFFDVNKNKTLHFFLRKGHLRIFSYHILWLALACCQTRIGTIFLLGVVQCFRLTVTGYADNCCIWHVLLTNHYTDHYMIICNCTVKKPVMCLFSQVIWLLLCLHKSWNSSDKATFSNLLSSFFKSVWTVTSVSCATLPEVVTR